MPIPPSQSGSKLKNLGKQVKEAEKSQPPHMVIVARAGTGKTSTLVEGMKIIRGMKPEFTPSDQQAVIWEDMARSKNAYSVCFAAFGKDIALDLERRVPPGTEATTMHRMGSRTIRRNSPSLVCDADVRKDAAILEAVTGKSRQDLQKDGLYGTLATLMEKCKLSLIDWNDEIEVMEVVDHHGIEIEEATALKYAKPMLDMSMNTTRFPMYNFADMLWLPLVTQMPIYKFDVLLIDEAQDMSRSQQEFALKAGKRIIACGDPKQAIFGFAGAESDSMERLEVKLSYSNVSSKTYPLNVTFRCSKAVVKEAQKYVPDFFAAENSIEGEVKQDFLNTSSGRPNYRSRVEAGDMILSRTNAPLISECIKFLREGRKARILGRDIGGNLISLVFRIFKKLGLKDPSRNSSELQDSNSITMLKSGIEQWKLESVTKENAKKFPSEQKLQSILDRTQCLLYFCEYENSASAIISRIETVFADKSTDGIILSSIHKAKGLEANNVWVLQPKTSFSQKKEKHAAAWELEQENNLKYVAITRAKKTLTYIY